MQNYGAWSEEWFSRARRVSGVEYFCFEGDEIWNMSDEQAVELAKGELARIGLIDPSKVIDGVKVLVPKAYPMYDYALRGGGRDDPRHISSGSRICRRAAGTVCTDTTTRTTRCGRRSSRR